MTLSQLGNIADPESLLTEVRQTLIDKGGRRAAYLNHYEPMPAPPAAGAPASHVQGSVADRMRAAAVKASKAEGFDKLSEAGQKQILQDAMEKAQKRGITDLLADKGHGVARCRRALRSSWDAIKYTCSFGHLDNADDFTPKRPGVISRGITAPIDWYGSLAKRAPVLTTLGLATGAAVTAGAGYLGYKAMSSGDKQPSFKNVTTPEEHAYMEAMMQAQAQGRAQNVASQRDAAAAGPAV